MKLIDGTQTWLVFQPRRNMWLTHSFHWTSDIVEAHSFIASSAAFTAARQMDGKHYGRIMVMRYEGDSEAY